MAMTCNPFFCFPREKPERSEAKKNTHRAATDKLMLEEFDIHTNDFAVGLDRVFFEEPGVCLLSACGSCCGCTACYFRHLVLKTYARGTEDFVCFQGYLSNLCCCDVATCLPGSSAGLCLEGCCCPMLSLSIARIHIMDLKRLRPDPMDYQIIACSNALQCLSCICDTAALFDEGLRDLATIIDLIADAVTCSVGGCMGAQVYHEINRDANDASAVTAPIAQAIERAPLARTGTSQGSSSSKTYGSAEPPIAVAVPVKP